MAASSFQRLAWSLVRLPTRLMDRLDAVFRLPDDRREAGASSVEFVIIFPFFFFIFLLAFEASVLLIRQVMLERGLDLAVREIRLDSASAVGIGQLTEGICDRAAILPDCLERMVVELRVIDPTNWAVPSVAAPCTTLTRSVVPPTRFDVNRASEMVIVRACYAVDPVFPGAPLGARLVDDRDGALRMVAASVFVVEPDPNT